MSEEIRNEQANRIVESPGDTGPIMTPRQTQAISANQARSEFSEQYVKPVVAELIGTFGFVFIGAGSIITNALTRGAVGLVGIALATGLALAIMITIFAATSGGHFFLLLAVFGTAVDPRAPKIGGFGIGLTVLVDILVGGPLTGASMNPARTFGPALASGFWQNDLVYWIGPIIGAVIAASIYEYVILRPRRAGQEMAHSGVQKD